MGNTPLWETPPLSPSPSALKGSASCGSPGLTHAHSRKPQSCCHPGAQLLRPVGSFPTSLPSQGVASPGDLGLWFALMPACLCLRVRAHLFVLVFLPMHRSLRSFHVLGQHLSDGSGLGSEGNGSLNEQSGLRLPPWPSKAIATQWYCQTGRQVAKAPPHCPFKPWPSGSLSHHPRSAHEPTSKG